MEKLEILRQPVGQRILRYASLDDVAIWGVGGAAVFIAAGVLLLASVSGKLLGTHIAGKMLKWQPGEASLIGW